LVPLSKFNQAWIEAGAKDAAELAAERVKAIIRCAPEPRLEPRVLSELRHIVKLAEGQDA
jgi:trimethylamine:corrinoid methyltransferase-like protein